MKLRALLTKNTYKYFLDTPLYIVISRMCITKQGIALRDAHAMQQRIEGKTEVSEQLGEDPNVYMPRLLPRSPGLRGLLHGSRVSIVQGPLHCLSKSATNASGLLAS